MGQSIGHRPLLDLGRAADRGRRANLGHWPDRRADRAFGRSEPPYVIRRRVEHTAPASKARQHQLGGEAQPSAEGDRLVITRRVFRPVSDQEISRQEPDQAQADRALRRPRAPSCFTKAARPSRVLEIGVGEGFLSGSPLWHSPEDQVFGRRHQRERSRALARQVSAHRERTRQHLRFVGATRRLRLDHLRRGAGAPRPPRETRSIRSSSYARARAAHGAARALVHAEQPGDGQKHHAPG